MRTRTAVADAWETPPSGQRACVHWRETHTPRVDAQGEQEFRAKSPDGDFGVEPSRPGRGNFLGTSETPHGMTLALEGRSQSDQTVAIQAE